MATKPSLESSSRSELAGRFHGRYVVNETTGCWEWARGKFARGYGAISFKGKTLKAHRVSYLLHKGPLVSGMFVCHKCDNPQCVNPEHLFLGTPLDNARDMCRKGRKVKLIGPCNPRYGKKGEQATFYGKQHSEKARSRMSEWQHGSKSRKAKLNEDTVRYIMAHPEISSVDLGKKFNVSHTAIWQIRTGFAWNQVTGLPLKRHANNSYEHRKRRNENKTVSGIKE